MASIDSKLATLRRRAAKNDLEVEHLTEFAVIGDARAVPVIQELRAKHDWSPSNHDGDANIVPLARWSEVVCNYLEGGCDALVEYARSPEQESLYFAVSILAKVKSAACVLSLAELSADIATALPARVKDGVKLADAINLTLSFKNPPPAYPDTAMQLCSYLHAMLLQDLNEHERARIVCALREVGDEESIRLIGKLPKFKGAWVGLESLACKVIRKRIRDS